MNKEQITNLANNLIYDQVSDFKDLTIEEVVNLNKIVTETRLANILKRLSQEVKDKKKRKELEVKVGEKVAKLVLLTSETRKMLINRYLH
jgi:hypothetical protein